MRKVILWFILVFASAGLNWADDLNMELVGRELFGPAHDIYVVNNYAYLCGGGDLVILDIGNPSKPSEVARLNTPGVPAKVHVSGNYAYIVENGLCDYYIRGHPSDRRIRSTESR